MLLAERHGKTITDLQISKIDDTFGPYPPFYGLEKLHLANLNPHDSHESLSLILVKNHSSLKHLKLGCERILARFCLLGINPIEEGDQHDFTDIMLDEFAGAFEIIECQRYSRPLQLHTLHLIGLDFGKLTVDSEAPLLELSGLSRLNALTLESCFIEGATFSLLSPQTAIGSTWTPRLQSFSLRYEKSNATFQHHLRAFLGRFTGLVHLSVLLEGSGGYMDLDCFIENHGKTLETLVWDQRSEPRMSVGQSTIIFDDDFDLFSYTSMIAQGCPGLRELGLSVVAGGYSLTYEVSHCSCLPLLNGQYTYS